MTTWASVEDGEYNEQTARIGQRIVRLYSDRDGEDWRCTIDDGEEIRLDATTEARARIEAEREAQ